MPKTPVTAVRLGSRIYRIAALSVPEILELWEEMEHVASIRASKLLTDKQVASLAKIVHSALVKNHPNIRLSDVPNMLGGGNAHEALAAALASDHNN